MNGYQITQYRPAGGVCHAKVNKSGARCRYVALRGGYYCGIHQPNAKAGTTTVYEESMEYRPDGTMKLTKRKTVIKGSTSKRALCSAPVKATGKRCTSKHKEGSRWCPAHFAKWHGKDSPKW